MKTFELRNLTNPLKTGITLKVCDTFLAKLRGFTFTREIQNTKGLVLVSEKESKLDSGIHMLFVFFDLGILWLDEKMVIVDLNLAKKWKAMLIPAKPAKYVIEIHPERLAEFTIGDQIEFC